MAAWQLYNHTLGGLWAGDFPATHTFKVMLLDATATFDATHVTISEVSSAEVSGNGWAVGGEPLENVVSETADTNGAIFDADDLIKAITGGDLDPYKALAVYDDTSATDKPLAYLQLTDAITVVEGKGVGVFFPADGIIIGTVA